MPAKRDSIPKVSRNSDGFNLRLPDGMRDKISKAAAQNGRSMNTEIVARLQSTFLRADKDEPLLVYMKAQDERIAQFEKVLMNVFDAVTGSVMPPPLPKKNFRDPADD